MNLHPNILSNIDQNFSMSNFMNKLFQAQEASHRGSGRQKFGKLKFKHNKCANRMKQTLFKLH